LLPKPQNPKLQIVVFLLIMKSKLFSFFKVSFCPVKHLDWTTDPKQFNLRLEVHYILVIFI